MLPYFKILCNSFVYSITNFISGLRGFLYVSLIIRITFIFFLSILALCSSQHTLNFFILNRHFTNNIIDPLSIYTADRNIPTWNLQFSAPSVPPSPPNFYSFYFRYTGTSERVGRGVGGGGVGGVSTRPPPPPPPPHPPKHHTTPEKLFHTIIYNLKTQNCTKLN
jgi:hypothetical protein